MCIYNFDWVNEALKNFNIPEDLINKSITVEKDLATEFERIENIRQYNQLKVLKAFQDEAVSEIDLGISRGYGYNDMGRDKLERIFARVFSAEASLVRISMLSGTTAISTVLFGLLRPGDELLAISGKPYDTLDTVIGINMSGDNKQILNNGSLRDFNISYNQVDLLSNSEPDLEQIKKSISSKTKMVHIQRSRGYSQREALSIATIEKMILTVKSIRDDIIVFVDNCYGEFTEIYEPTDVGADIIAGSLIKNPGGGLAPAGGYIVGKEKYVDLCAQRYSAPGLGSEVGASLGYNRLLYQGFYMSPNVVADNLKGLCFASKMLEEYGFETSPSFDANRSDIVQIIKFSNKEDMISFVEAIQEAAPIDSFVKPIPAYMPGYTSDVIMAAGAFVQGSSIELSADGPVVEPYLVYMQGGLVYPNIKLATLLTLKKMRY